MAISNGYATLTAFKLRAGLPAGGQHDDDAERAVEAASRAVDEWCSRRFWTDTVATARYFTAQEGETTLLPVDDFSVTTGLVVKTDDDWDGVYENTWTLNSRSGPYGFMVEPDNAAVLGLPFCRLHAIANSFPTGSQGIQVTALWGWASVPAPITEACLLLASRYYKRKDTPFAAMGTQETGFIELPRVDPDVAALLAPYRKMA